MQTNQNFTMVSGDTKIVEVTIDNVDLSGASAKWLMHYYGQSKVTKDASITDAVSGKVSFTLDPIDTADLTGIFSHEMEVRDVVGNVSTVMSGKVTIEKGYIV